MIGQAPFCLNCEPRHGVARGYRFKTKLAPTSSHTRRTTKPRAWGSAWGFFTPRLLCGPERRRRAPLAAAASHERAAAPPSVATGNAHGWERQRPLRDRRPAGEAIGSVNLLSPSNWRQALSRQGTPDPVLTGHSSAFMRQPAVAHTAVALFLPLQRNKRCCRCVSPWRAQILPGSAAPCVPRVDGRQSWLRSSEQFPRFDKCRSAGFEVLLAA